MTTLGVILARGGSKRLPGKNLRPLFGRPMIAWTIAAAQLSNVDTVVVSSDSAEIINTALIRNCIAIRRPDELATDTASPYDAIRHAYEYINEEFNFIALLQPTSPLRTAEDINICIMMAHKTDLPSVVSFEEGFSRPNGAVYIGKTKWLVDGGNFDIGPYLRYEMPHERSVDVDTLEDFDRAQALALSLA